MPKITLFNAETVGVDMKTNPLFLGGKKLHSAVNLAFDEGTLKTRPGFVYSDVIASGCFQGVGEYRPARGISSRAFGESGCSLFVVVDGALYRDGCPTGFSPFSCAGPIHIFQAESYLIFQSPQTKTYWWDGSTLVESKGMNESDWNDPSPQRTIIEPETPVANIPACENIDGDENYLLMFYVIDSETQEPLKDVRVTVYRNNRVHKEGLTGSDGRWSFRTKKRTYVYEMFKHCYLDITATTVVVKGDQEVIRGMEYACQNCDWDITSATVSSNGSLTSLGTVTIANTGEIDLFVNSIGVVCGNSVIDPALPFTIPAGETQVFTVASLDCELTDTALSVNTNCGDLNGVWEPEGGGTACGFSIFGEHADTEDPEPRPENLYYWVVFDIVNTGTESIELSEMVYDGNSTQDPLFMGTIFPLTINVGETQHISFPWVYDGSGYELRGQSVLLITSCGSTSIYLPNTPPIP